MTSASVGFVIFVLMLVSLKSENSSRNQGFSVRAGRIHLEVFQKNVGR